MISKIDGPGGPRPTQNVRRAGKSSATGGTGFSKHLDETDESASSHGVTGANSISGILGVQEVDDALHHASKGKMRAEDILDRLDDLRLEILTGSISRDKLLQLAHVVSTRRGEVTDPRLIEVLNEIDLRAQVELAKFAANNPA